LKLAIDTVINSADARTEGFGKVNDSRLSLMASQVSDAFGTKTRVDRNAVWNGSFLPRSLGGRRREIPDDELMG